MTEDIRILLEDFVNHGFSIAEENVDKDCDTTRVTSAALGISESAKSGFLAELPWEDDKSKILMLHELGKKCYEEKMVSVALLNDAAMKQYKNKPDHDTELPLTYPPDMRVDCLILCFIDFKNPKENLFKSHPYKITGGKLVREEPISFVDSMVSMDSLLMNCISLGFLKAAIFDQYQKKEILNTSFSKEVGDMLLKEVLKEYPGATLGNTPKYGES